MVSHRATDSALQPPASSAEMIQLDREEKKRRRRHDLKARDYTEEEIDYYERRWGYNNNDRELGWACEKIEKKRKWRHDLEARGYTDEEIDHHESLWGYNEERGLDWVCEQIEFLRNPTYLKYPERQRNNDRSNREEAQWSGLDETTGHTTRKLTPDTPWASFASLFSTIGWFIGFVFIVFVVDQALKVPWAAVLSFAMVSFITLLHVKDPKVEECLSDDQIVDIFNRCSHASKFFAGVVFLTLSLDLRSTRFTDDNVGETQQDVLFVYEASAFVAFSVAFLMAEIGRLANFRGNDFVKRSFTYIGTYIVIAGILSLFGLLWVLPDVTGRFVWFVRVIAAFLPFMVIVIMLFSSVLVFKHLDKDHPIAQLSKCCSRANSEQ